VEKRGDVKNGQKIYKDVKTYKEIGRFIQNEYICIVDMNGLYDRALSE